MILDIDDHSTRPFANSAANETSPAFSPDGRWMLFVSDETGRREVYVRAYPGPEGKWQISSGGGVEPSWNRNGREVFYRAGSKMMSVTVRTEQGFSADQPQVLFEGRYRFAPYPTPNYDVSTDGQRFLMLKPAEAPIAGIHVVLNWLNRVDEQLAATTK
jgi:serine/threonine-protein kinase